QPALAAGFLVALGLGWILDDRCPGIYGIRMRLLGCTVEVGQHVADVGEAYARWRVGVPAERRTARAATRFVFRRVRSYGRIIGLLGFPGDDAVFDVDLPRAGAGAVHSVSRTHHL